MNSFFSQFHRWDGTTGLANKISKKSSVFHLEILQNTKTNHLQLFRNARIISVIFIRRN